MTICKEYVPNRDFYDNVHWNLNTFRNFVNSNPGIKEQLNRVLSNYGIIPPDGKVLSDISSFPDPEYLVRVIEEGLSIHDSFKDYMRGNLRNIQRYLMRGSMLVAETVLELKGYYRRMIDLLSNINGTKSPLMKNQFVREMLDSKVEVDKLSDRFNYLVTWRKKLLDGIRNNL
jgi:hypothetical protein